MGGVLGIIGGFGPEGITDFLGGLVAKTRNGGLCSGMRVFIDYNCRYGDFNLARMREQPDILEELLDSVRVMEGLGVQYIVVPCIEAHYYIPMLKEKVNVEFIDALRETNEFMKKHFKNDSRVGVLATTGAIESGIFKDCLKGYRLLYPPKDIQEGLVMEAVFGEKGIRAGNGADQVRKLLKDAAGYLIYMGAQLLIAGSAEISMVLRQEHVGICMIDPIKILTNRVIDIFSHKGC